MESNISSKPIPVLYERKEDCCGCTACYAICPKQAITMQPDEEGFDYPVVNPDICIRCYMCLKVCPIKAAKAEKVQLSPPKKNAQSMTNEKIVSADAHNKNP